jgi:hypothetical protein
MEDLWGIGDTGVIMSGLTYGTLSVWLLNECSLAGKLTRFEDLLAWPPQQPIHLHNQVQYKRGTGGSFVEKPAKSQLASQLSIRSELLTPSGVCEFESPKWTWTQHFEKTLETYVQSSIKYIYCMNICMYQIVKGLKLIAVIISLGISYIWILC